MAFERAGGIRLILRLEIKNTHSIFGYVATAIGAAGGDIMAVDLIQAGKESVVRDVTVGVDSPDQGERVVAAVSALPGVRVINVSDRVFLAHLGGKIEVTPKIPVKNRDDLSMVYTPGVARVCQAIHQDPAKVFSLTMKRNTVAVVTDGTAVLGLGDIGPAAALPVMEGKAMLFKQFANVDAVPICLDTKDPDEIVQIVKRLAPGFGGINLEDISSPRCFYIEERLKEELDIPVFHDDQHGTAVVVLAGLLNAVKLVGKRLEDLKVVVVGIGAAGSAVIRLLLEAGVQNVIGVDRMGIIERGKEYPQNPMWTWIAQHTNPEGITGNLADAIDGADVFVGVSGPGVLNVGHLRRMAKDPIVFAMANPEPEIEPEVAAPHVRVLATGRSDYPNQVNNLLCFPGIFRGALDCRARTINEEMKLAAARAIAGVVSDAELSEEYIIPSVFNRRVVDAVSQAVIEAAYATGVARRERRDVVRDGRYPEAVSGRSGD
ncbi:NAD-dependent malic enzyme [Caldinitratiruptor microaerophilus]|uniref:Malate oxidoreductase n=1 Tax=Caldinitratiruptor microaerophilus TaxID=671077 RepID=A0AA35G9V5_9FIRM|nr:NAD-dependent malic enzyme [Caldinitratiruptor microaerophilus]BDG60679.1 malate oxidoreductase [Caldinitratiruptor microaerophilus]